MYNVSDSYPKYVHCNGQIQHHMDSTLLEAKRWPVISGPTMQTWHDMTSSSGPGIELNTFLAATILFGVPNKPWFFLGQGATVDGSKIWGWKFIHHYLQGFIHSRDFFHRQYGRSESGWTNCPLDIQQKKHVQVDVTSFWKIFANADDLW